MSGKTGLKQENQQFSPSPKPSPDVKTTLARFITNITAPPLLAVPTYIVLDLYDEERRGVAAANFTFSLTISVLLGVILPIVFILILRSKHQITDVHIPIRQQRTVPFLVTIGFYALATACLWVGAGGGALTATLFCYMLNTIIVTIINFAWKISVHATGVGGPLAALTLVYGWAVWPFFLLFPVVGWARIHLKAHTPAQVIAGSLFGYFFTLFQLLLIFRPLGWI